MNFNLNDILTTQEDPEDLFQLLEKLGKKYITNLIKVREIMEVYTKPCTSNLDL
jgi:hypothetical protein